MIKHSGHLKTLEKCRKLSPAARVFYSSLVFSNDCRVLSQCNTRLRFLYLLMIITSYCMNKSGFYCALSFCPCLLNFAPFFSLFFFIFPRLHTFCFRFFSCTSNHLAFRATLAYQSLFYTTTLRGSVENYTSTNHYYFT